MDKAEFDELVVRAAEQPGRGVVEKLSEALKNGDAPSSDSLQVLWDVWAGQELDTIQSELCLVAAEHNTADNPAFRKLLVVAIKTLLPNNLGHNPVMRALGVRDERVALPEVARLMRNLQSLKNGTVVFLVDSGRWGVAGTIDPINCTLPLTPFRGVGSNGAVPLEQVVKNVVSLELDIELEKLVLSDGTPIPAAKFREIVGRRARIPVSEELMRAMAMSGCARKMSPMAFDSYWNAKEAAAAVSARRTSSSGRSLQEINLLLIEEEKTNAAKFTAEDLTAFAAVFTRLRAETALREGKLLGEVVGRIAGRCDRSEWPNLFASLLGKAPFWPQNIQKAPLAQLGVWGELPAKSVEALSAVTAGVFDADYLAAAMTRLPLKALNGLGAYVSADVLYDMICENKTYTADLLLWIWKNAKKHKSDELISLVTIDTVCRVLLNSDMPKAWTTSRRELRNLMMDNAPFQERLLASAGGNMLMFTSVLQGALFLLPSERQSLLVKLARLSPALLSHIEGGAGQLVLKAGVGKTTVGDAPAEEIPNLTSVKSHQRLIKELEDIINVQIPENREALKTARAHGDFRENSEFDAAKERRNHLGRRRSELEKELAQLQSLIMKNVVVKDTAVVGSAIELAYDDGKKENYFLLGSWDGDPDRKFLSFRTKLGRSVLNRKVGDKFEAPGNRTCTLVGVSPLPAELIAELDSEN